jgi:hypothetical protein
LTYFIPFYWPSHLSPIVFFSSSSCLILPLSKNYLYSFIFKVSFAFWFSVLPSVYLSIGTLFVSVIPSIPSKTTLRKDWRLPDVDWFLYNENFEGFFLSFKEKLAKGKVLSYSFKKKQFLLKRIAFLQNPPNTIYSLWIAFVEIQIN